MSNVSDVVKEAISFLFKLLTKSVEYIDIVTLKVKMAYIFIAPIIDKIRELVAQEDEILAGFTALTEEELDAKKSIAFNRVVDKTQSYFSASPSFVPRGFVKGLVEDLVYEAHHSAGDERDEKARKHGYIRSFDAEETKKLVEDGLNKGWVSK